ncbi:MAG: cation:proton antiporter [Lawsonibacter sp.]|jgi:NhaP-type Na+/H+ or K+/H+ antiporter
MLTSLAYVFLAGLSMAALCQMFHLPRIIGMLFTGILLGPYVLNLLDPSILSISSDLRQLALVIILIKAGLSLNLGDLKQVGRPALLMSCLPASFEILAYTLLAPLLFGVSWVEGAIMGAVLGAVSPAVVVPRMVSLIEGGWGTKKSIPQMVLAGASMDDVYVIVLFSTFLSIEQGGTASAASFVSIPISILMGIAIGCLSGWGLSLFFEARYLKKHHIRNSTKVIIILGIAFLLLALENALDGTIPFSGILAVTAMACAIHLKCPRQVSDRLSQKFGKLWLAAEVILFVLVGAAVDIRYTLKAGPGAVAIIFSALLIRAIGVSLALAGTSLTKKERLFCIIAYLPKATVQAAIGSVPLSLGLPCGPLVLSVAVLAILLTAPLGAFGMDHTYSKLLSRES